MTKALLPTTLFVLSLSALAAAPIQSLDEKPRSRGALLYETHCIACHNTEVHWRDKTVVTNGDSLVSQVRRWQASIGLRWGEDDIQEVVHHLDTLYYHLPQPKK